MQSLTDFMWSLGAWNWFILAVLLFGLETIIPGVHFLWFGLAAVVVGLAAYAAPGLGIAAVFTWPWQLVVFALVSVATVFLVKRFARAEAAETDEPDLNVRGAQYVGRMVLVEDAISGGRGKVRVGDTLWSAEGPDAAKGARVRVAGVRGTVLVVESCPDTPGNAAQ